MPFYAANQQTKTLPYFSRWTSLFPKRKWQFNQGAQVLGVVEEYSPLTTQTHKPKLFTNTPLKTTVSQFERTNIGLIYRHKFESPLISFLPSCMDINIDKMKWRVKDLNRQIMYGFDMFNRGNAWNYAPSAYVVGASDPLVTGLPVGPSGQGALADPKTTATIQSLCAGVGSDGFLNFANICAVRSYARDIVGIVPWDGVPGQPKDNMIMGGNYLLMGEGAIYEDLAFDTGVLNIRPLEMNLVNRGFRGLISDNIIFRQESHPLRIAEDGTFPAPEIEQELPVNGTITSGSSTVTNPGGAARNIQVVPNPAYTRAPFGIAFFIGNEPFETLDVGAPPAAFANAKMDTAKVGKLSWNGEVRITDNVLVNYGGAAGLALENLDTNKYGEFVQLYADTTLGFFPKTSRFILPIIYRRKIAASLNGNLQ